MNKGILLIAAGHPYYGKMAAALAATIRVMDSEIPIHLAFTESAVKYLSTGELSLFSSSDIIPVDYYTTEKGNNYIRIKMYMYELSPFKKTLFLDCDLLWLKKSVSDLFDELAGKPITYQNHGYIDLSRNDLADNIDLWANINEVKSAYKFIDGKYYLVHSEVFYFEKGTIANKYFKTALKIYDNIKVKATVFAGSIPDELPFAIATSQLQIFPHQDKYKPSYWIKSGDNRHIYELSEEYYLISMAGINQNSTIINNYNILTTAAYQKLGLQQPYQWKNKRSFFIRKKNNLTWQLFYSRNN